MNTVKKRKWWAMGIEWLLAAFVGFMVSQAGDRLIDYRIARWWNDVAVELFGPSIIYKTEGQPVIAFTSYASKLFEPGQEYIITCTPDAGKIALGSGRYGPYKTYFDMTIDILNKNSNNLSYKVDKKQRVIHIDRKITEVK